MSKLAVHRLPNGDEWFHFNVDGRSIRAQIFKDRSPFYTARFDFRGKSYLRTSGTDVPAVAAKVLREKVRAVFSGQEEASKERHSGATVADVVSRYRAGIVSLGKVRASTAKENVGAFLRIVRAGLPVTANAEKARLRDVDWTGAFAAYVQRLRERAQEVKAEDPWAEKRVPVTANSALRMARSLFTSQAQTLYAGLVLPDPLPLAECHVLAGEPSTSYDPGVWVDMDGMKDAALQLRYAEPAVWVAIALAANLGMRRGELAAMRWEWIERTREGARVAIVERADYKPKRAGRRVALAEGLRIQLEEFRGRSGRDFVLGETPTERRNVLIRASQWVKQWKRPGARSKKTMHELRKHFGSVLLEQHGLERAAEALGHAPGSTVTRKHYATFLSQTPAVEVL